MHNPLEITLGGPLLETVRRLAANENMTVEDWVIAHAVRRTLQSQPRTTASLNLSHTKSRSRPLKSRRAQKSILPLQT